MRSSLNFFNIDIMKITHVMRNAFLNIRQGGERLRSAPPKDQHSTQYNYQPHQKIRVAPV